MPRRRPPRDCHVVNHIFLLAAVIFFLPWLVDAQQQQRQAVQQRHELLQEGTDKNNANANANTLEATQAAQQTEIPLTFVGRKNTFIVDNVKNDASAIATLAPAASAVAAPPTRPWASGSAGLSSPQIARSLGDWEVEDFVLLATVDGTLYASDRKTGKQRWHISPEYPMVQTNYHPRNQSAYSKGSETNAIDNYLWIVEPSRDGTLYIYRPDGPKPGLVNTGLTMKKLVDLSPFGDEDPPVMYTGEKKNELLTVDANTGAVLTWFGATNSLVIQETCNIDGKGDSEEAQKCPKTSTLVIGRTTYTVGIHGKDGHHIATLTFSEWGPNNYDLDLQRQYMQYATTFDNKYVYTGHDGGIIGFDHERSAGAGEPGLLFNHKFKSPVVRVFDIARPWGSDKNSPDLAILPQPLPPSHEDHQSALTRAKSIFLNHTEDGSWYAMSGKSYPLAIGGIQKARCSQEGWLQRRPRWDLLNSTQLSEALVGLHSIDNEQRDSTEGMLTISAPASEDSNSNESYDEASLPKIIDEDKTVLRQFRQIPYIAVHSLVELLKNPILLLLILAMVISNQRKIRVSMGNYFNITHNSPSSLVTGREFKATSEVDVLPKIPEDRVVEIPVIKSATGVAPSPKNEEKAVMKCEILEKRAELVEGEDKTDFIPDNPKKKAHRGRRGGVKHKKGLARTSSQDGSIKVPRNGSKAGSIHELANGPSSIGTSNPRDPPSVGEIVKEAQQMGPRAKIEPDIQNISSDPQEISGPLIRIGALEVNTEKLIGTGSNGTMVFEGKFDGREVAVKRMLMQFFDIASQETKLLRESDDHPNVIRYFSQQQAAGFLYIALELCPASLADVIDKPNNHRELAQAGERNLPKVLYQITNGLRHLHKLRIVHRDLKPQNILVSMGKDGNPRLLVSDFGLCKKLEGEQSSFRATTAHAAGTSGWRAPELLLDDDAKEGHQALVDASTDGNSGSIVLGADLLPNRRATRAIDIFSLGLVFFYVLTKGSHPFDCGDRFMREVNIRKGHYDLRALEILGDSTYEAKDIIASMLHAQPKVRPQAHQVMAHPFFWSPKKRLNFMCDVSDHFEKEKREPPTAALLELEAYAPEICGSDFMKLLGKDFVDSMGKQRKYTGTRLLDLLRALRNKRNHYEDMSDKLKRDVGPLPDGYLSFWTRRFPRLLIACWMVVYEVQWDDTDRFREYYEPSGSGI